jgi:hypothetical protein
MTIYSSDDDPLGLFDDERPRVIESDPASPQTPVSAWLVVAGLVVAAVLSWKLAIDKSLWGDGSRRKDDQGEVQPALAAKTLIFIHERNPQPIEHDLLLRELPAFCGDSKLQFRSLDDDISDAPVPDLLAWAKTKGVSPPLVIVTDEQDRPAKVTSWPESIEKLEAWLR